MVRFCQLIEHTWESSIYPLSNTRKRQPIYVLCTIYMCVHNIIKLLCSTICFFFIICKIYYIGIFRHDFLNTPPIYQIWNEFVVCEILEIVVMNLVLRENNTKIVDSFPFSFFVRALYIFSFPLKIISNSIFNIN